MANAQDIYAKHLYAMKLFDINISESGITARRVPGGWIFTEKDSLENQPIMTSVFVPYNPEFDPMAQKIKKIYEDKKEK